jgi:hypothetical protein
MKKLPYIVTSFSSSIKYTKGKVHCWNRMRNQKVIIDAVIPIEIEKYIIKRINNIDEFIESKLSIAILIKNSWYISYRPFKNAIIELINEYLKTIKDVINKRTVIIIDNLMRKKERPFDTFYAGDLAWLFGIYFNTMIQGSKLVTYRNKNMESNFPQSQYFPFKYYCKQVYGFNDFDIFKDIVNYIDYDYILYIKKYIQKPDDLNKLGRIICENYNSKQTIIIWELLPYRIISTEKYQIHLVQGFTERNFAIIENLMKGEKNL